MTDQKGPDYDMEDDLSFDDPAQYSALFDDTRFEIVSLLHDRAATIKELADTLDKPKGTIGYHVGVLEQAGLIRIVRTERVRAIEAKYYGRTARTYVLGDNGKGEVGMAPDVFLTRAAAEYAAAATATSREDPTLMSTLRHVRIPEERAAEWSARLIGLALEFASEPRAGDRTFGLLLAMYPTDRPHLPDKEAS